MPAGDRGMLSGFRTVLAAALGALPAAACGGETGTIDLTLVTAPGSTVLDGVQQVRLSLSDPRREALATRGSDGTFHLSLDVAADGPSANVTFQGEDGTGALIAYGCSGLLPIAAIDAAVAIYVAGPGTLAEAPIALDRPRADAGTGAFAFGVMIAGGRDRDGAASAAVDIYSVYSHQLQRGVDLPAARRAPTVAAGVFGYAYIFGGDDAAARPTGTLWSFDTTIAPAGAYQTLTDATTLARTGARAAAIRTEAFVLTGEPPAILDGVSGSVTALPATPALTGTASSITILDPAATFAVVAGAGTGTSGLALVTTASVDDEQAPAGTARSGHGAAVGGGAVTLIGGEVGGALATTGVRIVPGARSYTELPAGLATPRRDAAVAQVGNVILIAGGRDAAGDVLATAEILDATTLAHLATIPLIAARTGASAHTLASGQILVVGGIDAAGAPVATLELFTPDPTTAFAGEPVACGRLP